jgi:AraC-like DNA-binding protein
VNEAPVRVDARGSVVTTPSPTLFGPVREPFTYWREEANSHRDVSVVLTTLGTALLCGPILHELESGTADLECFVRKRALATITEQLHEARSTERIVSVLNRYFAARMANCHTRLADSLSRVLARLEAPTARWISENRYDVDTLKARVGLSTRHLQRVIYRSTGLTPKRYLSVMRINHVVEQMRRTPEVPLARIAAQFSYTDQAHFIRDFRRNTLSRPTEFFRSDDHREHRAFMDAD